jgi:hypothetical protein
MIGLLRKPGTARSAAVWVAVAGLAMASGSARPEPKHIVEDPHYGEVLFHFYQRDYFTAITRLLAAREQDRVPHHATEAELLEGGLKLSYGMHKDAARIFARLLDEQTDPALRNRAWFYLAKLSYQRGFPDEAATDLGRIEGRTDEELEAELTLLKSLVALDQGDAGTAIAALEGWSGPDDWEAYARFNLGVALVRAGRLEDGIDQLDRVGRMRARSSEMANLRDKANVAAGYALLHDGGAEPARERLARVRLEGPFANRALLGFGWADVERGAYQSALAPWTTLGEREHTDPAVQEALLAVPYALAKLGAPGRAAQRYEAAIGAFLEQATSLEQAIDEVHRGALLALLGSALQGADGGWFWELSEVPPSPLTRNLSELLASHGFQEALRNYRDLRFLQQNLDAWAQSVGSFEEMLATRRARYERVLPETQSYLAAMDIDALRARLTGLQQKLAQARAQDDGRALATAQELDQLARLAEMSTRIEALGEDSALEEAKTRQRFLQGVLHWELQAAAPARLWELEKSTREVQSALEKTGQRITSLERAQDAALIGFEGYADRIAAARSRINALRPAVAEVLAAQETRLESLAIDALRARQRRLKTYAVQARFSLAQIYDQLASDGGSEP